MCNLALTEIKPLHAASPAFPEHELRCLGNGAELPTSFLHWAHDADARVVKYVLKNHFPEGSPQKRGNPIRECPPTVSRVQGAELNGHCFQRYAAYVQYIYIKHFGS